MFNWLYGSILMSKADRLGTYAAALAYCFVLSMVPFLALTFMLGMNISGHLSQGKLYAQEYGEVLQGIIPTENAKEVTRIFEAVQHSSQGGFVTIGFILAAYTSFNLMDQIVRTLHFIFDDVRRPTEWTWRVAAKTIAVLLIWMFLLLVISITAVEATVLQRLTEHLFFSDITQGLVKISQILIVIGALFGTFYATYYLVPSRTYKSDLLVQGSLVASIGWVVCSMIFAYVLPKILQSSAAYIALGSVVIILLWAQACAWSVIMGACWIVRFGPRGK